jgi:hypothetical protein
LLSTCPRHTWEETRAISAVTSASEALEPPIWPTITTSFWAIAAPAANTAAIPIIIAFFIRCIPPVNSALKNPITALVAAVADKQERNFALAPVSCNPFFEQTTG